MWAKTGHQCNNGEVLETSVGGFEHWATWPIGMQQATTAVQMQKRGGLLDYFHYLNYCVWTSCIDHASIFCKLTRTAQTVPHLWFCPVWPGLLAYLIWCWIHNVYICCASVTVHCAITIMIESARRAPIIGFIRNIFPWISLRNFHLKNSQVVNTSRNQLYRFEERNL